MAFKVFEDNSALAPTSQDEKYSNTHLGVLYQYTIIHPLRNKISCIEKVSFNQHKNKKLKHFCKLNSRNERHLMDCQVDALELDVDSLQNGFVNGL